MSPLFGAGVGTLTGLDGSASPTGAGGVGIGAGLLGQHQIGAFSNPRNGQRPIDANQVRANDTALGTVHNAHDVNATVHVQSSGLASRPPAGIGGRKWLSQDDAVALLWFDTGSQWLPVTVDWAALLNRPSTFTPAAHTHPTSAVVGLDAALTARALLSQPAAFTTLTSTTLATSGDATIGAILNLGTGRQFRFGSRTYVFPSADGTTSQVLTTDGAGNLNWTTQTGTGGGGTPDWSNILNRPATFPPSAHNQGAETIVGGTLGAGAVVPAAQVGAGALNAATTLGWTQLLGVPATFPPAGHTQDWSTITGRPATFPSDWSTIASRPATFPPSAHRHGWSELDNIPATFAPSPHTHPWSAITSIPTTFPPSAHTHAISEVVGLQAVLDLKANLTNANFANLTLNGVSVATVLVSAAAPSGVAPDNTLWIQV